MHRFDLDLQGLHQARESRRLAGGELEQEAAESGGVDDRVLERPGQATAQDPGVEGVVAVLDQHRAPGEVEEGPAGIAELGRVDQHLALDQVPALGVRVDRGPGVDERVEEAQRAAEPEALGADLEDEEGTIPGRLDVDRDELRLLDGRVGADGRVGVLVRGRDPVHRLARPAGLELQ